MMAAVGGFQTSRQGSIFKRVCGVGYRDGGADLDEVETGNLGGGLCKRNICRDSKQNRKREYGQSKEKNAGHSHGDDFSPEVSSYPARISARAAQALLEGSRSTTHGIIATAFGVLTLLFGTSGVLIELRDALNTIWEVPTPELSGLKMISSFVKERLFSFALVLAIGFLLVVSLAVSAWIAALGAWSASILPAQEVVLHVLNFVVSFVVITGLFSAIYRFLPDVRIEWRDVILGGAATSVLFTIGKLALGIYVGKASFASTYGATASIVVLIVWVYYSAQIFFLGAEFTKTFANCYGSQPSRHPDALEIDSAGNTKTSPATPNIVTLSQAEVEQRPEASNQAVSSPSDREPLITG